MKLLKLHENKSISLLYRSHYIFWFLLTIIRCVRIKAVNKHTCNIFTVFIHISLSDFIKSGKVLTSGVTTSLSKITLTYSVSYSASISSILYISKHYEDILRYLTIVPIPRCLSPALTGTFCYVGLKYCSTNLLNNIVFSFCFCKGI
jgi:hypothetical protein